VPILITEPRSARIRTVFVNYRCTRAEYSKRQRSVCDLSVNLSTLNYCLEWYKFAMRTQSPAPAVKWSTEQSDAGECVKLFVVICRRSRRSRRGGFSCCACLLSSSRRSAGAMRLLVLVALGGWRYIRSRRCRRRRRRRRLLIHDALQLQVRLSVCRTVTCQSPQPTAWVAGLGSVSMHGLWRIWKNKLEVKKRSRN